MKYTIVIKTKDYPKNFEFEFETEMDNVNTFGNAAKIIYADNNLLERFRKEMTDYRNEYFKVDDSYGMSLPAEEFSVTKS